MMTDQVKYLGVILDKKLDWKAHLENRMRKVCIAYWHYRSAVRRTWGLSPKVVAQPSISEVRPILSFASLVWWKRVELTGISGGMRSTPTSALEVMLMFVNKTRGQTGG
jgi:hypothetical protein